MSHTHTSLHYHFVFSALGRRGLILPDMTFQVEFLNLLKRHGVEYDPRYIWG